MVARRLAGFQVVEVFAVLDIAAGNDDVVRLWVVLHDMAVGNAPVFEVNFVVRELVVVFVGLDADERQGQQQGAGVVRP